jgi:hypothetical protein
VAFDDLMNKLSGYSWWYVKFCENDSCRVIGDSTYFYLQPSVNKFNRNLIKRIKFHTSKDILCISPQVYRRQRSLVADEFSYVAAFDVIPDFCFIDSNAAGGIFSIFTLGEEGFHRAELTFTSENEFNVRQIETSGKKEVQCRLCFRLRELKN